MQRKWMASLAAVVAVAVLAGGAMAATKVTVSETHLCCGQCLKGVEAALKGVSGVTHKSSQEAKTIEITAENDAAAQQALDALAMAGFYGKVDGGSAKYNVPTVATAKAKKVEVTGIHNCCGACTTAIKKAVTGVSGVSGTNIKNKDTTFTVEGDFEPKQVQDALLKAGFFAEVK